MAAKTLFEGGATGKLFLDRRQFYITPQKVSELWSEVMPFSTLLQNVTQKTGLKDPLFKMFEHRAPWIKQRFQVTSTVLVPNSDSASAAITIKDDTTVGLAGAVANVATDAYVGLICEVWTSNKLTKKGVVRINTVASATTITVKSMKAATVQLANDDYFVVMSNARGENTTAPEAWSDELGVVYNSTQFFSTPVEISGRLKIASLRGYNNELARLRDDKGKEFKMQIEHTSLKGTSVMGTGMSGTAMSDTFRTDANGKPVRTNYGIIPIIETYGSSDVNNDAQNIFSIDPAQYNYSSFVDDMEKVFQYESGHGSKFAFCGPGAMSYWSKVVGESGMAGNSGWTTRIVMSGSEKNTMGFKVKKLETPHGDLHLVLTKALKYEYRNTMLVVDESQLFNATYEEYMFKNNIKTEDDYDGVKDVYRADKGVGVTLQEAHQLFNIVQGV